MNFVQTFLKTRHSLKCKQTSKWHIFLLGNMDKMSVYISKTGILLKYFALHVLLLHD